MFSTSAVVAVLGFTSFVHSHMVMTTPVPFGVDLNNSPLDASGSDFPCKQRGDNTYLMPNGQSRSAFALGSSQPLAFMGSATHGGGSCQISITYDKEPTKNSVWKVIHSIEGGCPIVGVAGNNGDNADLINPTKYSFTIPTTIPTGDAVIAWTWFNKIGNREMYMNCAPVTLTGNTVKRTLAEDDLVANLTQLVQRDTTAYNALPDMFLANIGNGCNTVETTDVLFPNPGDSVEKLGLATSSALGTPVGKCAAATPGSAKPTTAAGGIASNPTTAIPAPITTSKVAGGVFATVAPVVSTIVVIPVAASTANPAAATSAAPANIATPTPAVVAPAASPVPATPSVPSTPSTGSSGVMSGACTTEGMWNCIGGSQFQRCASGTWSVVMALAAGTQCTVGITANINIVAKPVVRSVRFSREHIHRHLRRSI